MWKILLAAVAAVMGTTPILAQDAASSYPNQPIKIIVCVPAGGGTDRTTRIIAEKLRRTWGVSIIVDNRAGAGGNIGAEAVFRAKPDGYTLLAANSPVLTSNKFLYQMSFDPAQFEHISISSKTPNVLLVRPDFPAKTAQEFVAWVKANPGKLNFASQGVATTSHMTQALLASVLGVNFVHVPYRGSGPALNGIIASQVDAVFMDLASAYLLHEDRRARILAIVSTQRIQALPQIPTLQEIGVSVESGAWNGIVAPPHTPKAIVNKINSAINEALNAPDLMAQYRQLLLEAAPGTPADMAAFVEVESRRWEAIIRTAGIKPE